MNNFYIKKLDKKDFDNLNSQKLKLGIFVKVEEGGVFAVCNRSTSYYIKNPAGYFCIAYGLWTPAGLLSSENYAHGGFLLNFPILLLS